MAHPRDAESAVPRRRPRPLPSNEYPTEILYLKDELSPEEDVDEFADYEDDDEDSDEGQYAEEYVEDERPSRGGRRRGNRVFGWVAAIAVIALLAGGAWYGVTSIFGYEDFDGAGESDILLRVADGDSTNAIAARLADAGVVASSKAFVKAGAGESQLGKIQPGYYVLKTKMSGASAVDKLVEPTSRVGQLQIKAGTQFDDIIQPDGKVTEGIYTLLARASCAQLNGKSTCVPVEKMREAAQTADPDALGVPAWAVSAVKDGPKGRRLEGLISAGVYDVKPGWTATEILTEVVKVSAQRLRTAGLTERAGVEEQTPYQVLVIASIVEREAIKVDFPKISRVIYNRLAKNMKLEMDSTVNYLIDRPVVLTKPEDRAKAGPYNTYQTVELPPTPISAPSKEAIQAALQPAAGDWLFFVKCGKNGISCFGVTNAEHEKNKRDAQARGVY